MHAHDHSRAHDRRLLAVALGLIVALMAGEVVAGLLAGSLALLADAGHMLTDAAALAGALVASRLATRPARGPWTFGLGRAEILAAQANGITLLLVGDLDRLRRGAAARRSPPDVHGGIVVVVALVGHRRQPRRDVRAVARRPREPQRSRRIPARRDRPRCVRRHRASPAHSCLPPAGTASIRSRDCSSRR